MPHSLGLLYERITSHLGFLHSSDEYKVMALASFGKPAYRREFEDMITLNGSGDYRIGEIDFTAAFGPPRLPGAPFEKRHYDLAHSLQAALEETVLHLAAWLHEKTGMDSLCMAGGVALNCVMNAALRDRGPFKKIWIQPAAGDAGTALGAAMHVDARERKPAGRADRMDHVYLGPSYSDAEIESFSQALQAAYEPNIRQRRRRCRAAGSRRRLWAGSREEWNSVPGRWARAPYWRLRFMPRCRQN